MEYTVNTKDRHFWSKKLLTVLRLDMCPWLRLDLAIQTAKFVEKYEAKSILAKFDHSPKPTKTSPVFTQSASQKHANFTT